MEGLEHNAEPRHVGTMEGRVNNIGIAPAQAMQSLDSRMQKQYAPSIFTPKPYSFLTSAAAKPGTAEIPTSIPITIHIPCSKPLS
jgi:hypothetical protein